MILAGHQPVYLPGLATMAKMAIADAWMWVGHCDYQPRSWHSRNYIRGRANSLLPLSVPVVHNSGPSINQKLIDGSRWKDHQLKTIGHTYGRRPYFNQYFPELGERLHRPFRTLAELNTDLVLLLREWLEIDTPIYFSQDYNIGLYKGEATLMLNEMCEKMEATEYLSSIGEKAYVKPELMNGFKHQYIKFEHPVYNQGHKKFVPNLSVIDLVFNCGPESGTILRSRIDV